MKIFSKQNSLRPDVVIVNKKLNETVPYTDLAIAIRYDENGYDKAPKIILNSINFQAKKIKEMADKENIPICRNPPLARALYSYGEIDEVIPEFLYEAVAYVLAPINKDKNIGITSYDEDYCDNAPKIIDNRLDLLAAIVAAKSRESHME